MGTSVLWLNLVGKKGLGEEKVSDINRQGAGWECVRNVIIGKPQGRMTDISAVMIRPFRSGATMKVAPGQRDDLKYPLGKVDA